MGPDSRHGSIEMGRNCEYRLIEEAPISAASRIINHISQSQCLPIRQRDRPCRARFDVPFDHSISASASCFIVQSPSPTRSSMSPTARLASKSPGNIRSQVLPRPDHHCICLIGPADTQASSMTCTVRALQGCQKYPGCPFSSCHKNLLLYT